MTRITSLGRKRTYNEAQFNHIFDGDTKEQPQGQENEAEQPKKKKRKYEEHKKMKEAKNVPKIAGETSGKGWGRSEEVKANAAASENRRKRRIQERLTGTTCFACRQKGHAAKDCPSSEEAGVSKPQMGICYRCGSYKHTLSKCRKPIDEANPLPFANCFICKGTGHLASTCSRNTKGVYPNGGCCKLCGQTTHLAKNCSLRSNAPPAESVLFNSGADIDEPGADEDDFMAFKRKMDHINKAEQKQQNPKAKATTALKRKVVTF